MNLFCYQHNQFKEDCPKAPSGECALIETMAQMERGTGSDMPFIYMKGGTTELGRLMDHTRDFDLGMHQYREAVRNGEQPDSTNLGGVESARRRQESHERGQKKLDGMRAA